MKMTRLAWCVVVSLLGGILLAFAFSGFGLVQLSHRHPTLALALLIPLAATTVACIMVTPFILLRLFHTADTPPMSFRTYCRILCTPHV